MYEGQETFGIGKVEVSSEDMINVWTRSIFTFISFLNQVSPTGKNTSFVGKQISAFVQSVKVYNQLQISIIIVWLTKTLLRLAVFGFCLNV